jgi:hypothetical protein
MSQARIAELIAFSNAGLVPMFDLKEQLFCHRLNPSPTGYVREGISQRYTVMTLLGLREMELAGVASQTNMLVSFEALLRKTDWVQGVGDLGLLIWVVSVFDPGRLEDLLGRFQIESVLQRYADAKEARTMELAWFLTGLSYAAGTSTKLRDSLTDQAVETLRCLQDNQGACGFFGHLGTKKSLAGRFRGAIGSFADQVYPIFAMSKYAQFFHVEEPLQPALACADAICSAQGEQGQWWWLYDARHGRVASRYPVYAVHQHGMAPMALFAAEEATGKNFDAFVYKGLDWIYGENELGADMRDSTQSVIWRCIRSAQQSKYLEVARSLIQADARSIPAHKLQILKEQRPYEFGWLLFAFSKKCQQPS